AEFTGCAHRARTLLARTRLICAAAPTPSTARPAALVPRGRFVAAASVGARRVPPQAQSRCGAAGDGAPGAQHRVKLGGVSIWPVEEKKTATAHGNFGAHHQPKS